jgi:hypothetical protein
VAPARLEKLSRAYLGVPYRLDCLGEACGPDPDPLFTRARVDCQTLVEQVMAEALAPWAGGLDAAGKLVRYRGGLVSLETRHHYCVPDWLEHPWPAVDATSSLGPRLRQVRRRIDLPALVESRGGDPGRSPAPVRTVTASYLPRSAVPSALARVPDGSIAVLVHSRPDLVAGHVGFLFRRNGVVTLRHASQTRKQVVDEPLAAYLGRAPRKLIGLKVLKPDVAGLRR